MGQTIGELVSLIDESDIVLGPTDIVLGPTDNSDTGVGQAIEEFVDSIDEASVGTLGADDGDNN